jgi:hypothetical protein
MDEKPKFILEDDRFFLSEEAVVALSGGETVFPDPTRRSNN